MVKLPESELNLDLTSVYFLTTRGTASASESLMTGLDPYMDVVQIGTTTYGKCYASWTIEDSAEPKRHNWAMQPIVLKYINADGFTDFIDGLTPDFHIEEPLLLAPFGSLEDPLLARALEEITRVAPLKKNAKLPVAGFHPLPERRENLVEWVVEWPDRPEPALLR